MELIIIQESFIHVQAFHFRFAVFAGTEFARTRTDCVRHAVRRILRIRPTSGRSLRLRCRNWSRRRGKRTSNASKRLPSHASTWPPCGWCSTILFSWSACRQDWLTVTFSNGTSISASLARFLKSSSTRATRTLEYRCDQTSVVCRHTYLLLNI